MQAGLTIKRLTFRDIFTSFPNFLRLVRLIYIFIHQEILTRQDDIGISMADQQHWMAEVPPEAARQFGRLR